MYATVNGWPLNVKSTRSVRPDALLLRAVMSDVRAVALKRTATPQDWEV
ncbi:MAG: hypothetical protein IVW55_16770 [Chloroflexi bacterium]|nr:hypothetical protein [Chloroflexota bacterium]